MGLVRLEIVACCWLAWAAPPAHTQASPQGESPTIRTTVRLVEVAVIAETKQGEPVAGLTKEDFALLDEGRSEPITVFSAETTGHRGQLAGALPPNTFTNRFELSEDAPVAATAILFDGLNTRIPDQAYARQQVVEFLDRMEPGARVALYALGRGLNVLQDFTAEPAALKQALAKYRGDMSQQDADSLQAEQTAGLVRFNGWVDELKLNLIDYYARDRALRTIRSLVAIANHLERLPGRKSLVWVSGSFPVWIGRKSAPLPERPKPGEQSFWAEIEQAARALNRSNLAVYPVDAVGLMAREDYNPDRGSISRDMTGFQRGGLETMQVLAERTGGRAFFNNNDLQRALRQVLADARATYSLGFQPSHHQWDGKFREIRVRVQRPGVRLRHRSGYFAQPPEPADAWYRESVLSAAAWSPVDASRLGLTVHINPRNANAWDLELRLDPLDLSLEYSNGNWEGSLDVWFAQIGARDRHVLTTTHVARLRMIPAVYERAMQTREVVLMEALELSPDTQLVRVLVRDIRTGALGSLSIPSPASSASRLDQGK